MIVQRLENRQCALEFVSEIVVSITETIIF